MMPTTKERIEKAERMVSEGHGGDVCFISEFDGAAVSAQRWLSLAAKGGTDDMFSSDLTDEELKVRRYS